MRKITSFFVFYLFLFFAQSVNAQIKIEYSPTGQGGVLDYRASGPFAPAQFYSYVQTIYLAPEINASGDITSFQWHYNGWSTLANSQNITVYLGTTSKSSFSSATDYIPVSGLTQVYQGGFDVFQTDGWYTLTLQTPFHYDGNSNLVVAVNETHDDLDTSSFFYNSPVPTSRSVCYWGAHVIDPSKPEISYPGTPNYIQAKSIIPNIVINGLTKLCPLPTLLSTSEITNSSVKVSWDNSDAGTEVNTDYYYSTSNATPDGNTIPSGSVKATSVVINNPPLDNNTIYYIWLRNDCHGTKSSWTGPLVVNTECNSIDEFTENFDNLTNSNIPTCWTRILRSAAASNSSIGAIANNFTDGSVKSMLLKNDGSNLTNDDVILAMPKINTLKLGTYRLRFYAKNGSNDPQNGSIQVGTLNNVASKAVFTKFQDINLTANAKEYYIDFTGNETTDTYIGIRMTTTGVYGGVYIDNVIWEKIPPCEDVTNLAVPLTTANTAKVTWNTELDTYYQVALGSVTDTDPSKADIKQVGLGVKYYDLDKLSASTSYKVWVRTVCQGEVYGNWIGPVSFMTPCEGSLDTLIENFDKDTFVVPALPPCWTKILRGPTNSTFTDITTIANTTTTKYAYSGTNAVKFENAVATGENDVILVTPAITNLYDVEKQVVFFAKLDEHGNAAKLQVGTLESNSQDASFYVLEGNEFELTKNYQKFVVDLSVIPGKGKYLGFRVQSTTNTKIEIDDISFDLKSNEPDDVHLAINDFKNNDFKVYPNPVKDILTLECPAGINAVSVFNILGQEIISRKFDSANVNVEMGTLDSGVYLVKITSNAKVDFVRVVKE